MKFRSVNGLGTHGENRAFGRRDSLRLGAASGAALLAAAALPAVTFPAAARTRGRLAGSVSRIRGTAQLDPQSARDVRALELGNSVHMRDRVMTAGDTRVEIQLLDETTFTLGDYASITIDAFVFDPIESEGEAVFRLATGVFRMVTGRVGKLPGAPLRVETPMATIGIRGTDFWGHQTRDRLQLALLDGAGVYVENRAGRVEINQPGFVSVVTSPDVLPSRPERLPPEVLAEAQRTVAF